MSNSDKALTRAELELTQRLQTHFPSGVIQPEVIQQWNGCPANVITERLVSAFGRGPETVAPQPAASLILPGKSLADLGKVEFWLEMWKHLGWEINPSGLIVPAHQGDFNWLIVSPQGITPNKAYDINAKLFRCWRYTEDLDVAVKSNDRDAGKGVYVIRVRNRIEADKELKSLSAIDLQKKNIQTVTLTERFILETAVFLATGQHLDVHNWTLCAGSRHDGGHVPYCNWHGDKFKVHWSYPDHRYDDLRGREVIS